MRDAKSTDLPSFLRWLDCVCLGFDFFLKSRSGRLFNLTHALSAASLASENSHRISRGDGPMHRAVVKDGHVSSVQRRGPYAFGVCPRSLRCC